MKRKSLTWQYAYPVCNQLQEQTILSVCGKQSLILKTSNRVRNILLYHQLKLPLSRISESFPKNTSSFAETRIIKYAKTMSQRTFLHTSWISFGKHSTSLEEHKFWEKWCQKHCISSTALDKDFSMPLKDSHLCCFQLPSQGADETGAYICFQRKQLLVMLYTTKDCTLAKFGSVLSHSKQLLAATISYSIC